MKLVRRLYPFIIILLVFVVWKYRQGQRLEEKYSISGQTMGTTYNITGLDKDIIKLKPAIDSLLQVWNQSLSTYIPDSEISYFNNHDSLVYRSGFFLPVLVKSREVYEISEGAFDPTVMPLVNAWGFGPADPINPDSAQVDSVLSYIGFDKITFDSMVVRKKTSGVQLDFSAVAKGYGVDVVGEFIQSKGIHNYLVEIGGEILCRGVNHKGKPWSTGIEDPTVEIGERDVFAVLEIGDKAVATSGNYRNYYFRDGQKYSHTIDPFTGYPVDHTLLSATVVAGDCMTADAFATAFMVMGLEKSIKILEKQKNLDAYFIYSDSLGNLLTFSSERMKKMLKVPGKP